MALGDIQCPVVCAAHMAPACLVAHLGAVDVAAAAFYTVVHYDAWRHYCVVGLASSSLAPLSLPSRPLSPPSPPNQTLNGWVK